MNTKRFVLALLALAVIAVPPIASAAKVPTYYAYKGGCKNKICSKAIYTNSGNSKILTLQFNATCSNKTEANSYNSAAIKINSKHKYKVTLPISTQDTQENPTYGQITFTGKVTKKDKATMAWSIDSVAAGCENVKTGSSTLKYGGAVHGG